MVTVFIWQFRGKDIAWGHASLALAQTYISWWPEGRNRIRSKVSAQIYTVAPIRNRTFHQDVSDEGMQPDYRIQINGLNEPAIQDWWQGFGLVRNGQLYQGPLLPWETLAQNCSTVAGRGLSIGGGDRFAPWRKSWQIVWTPNDVLNYALAVQTGAASAKG